MSQEKSPLNEIASGASALRTARSEPIQQESAPRQTMDFIRSLVLDLPIQTTRDIVESTKELDTQEPTPAEEDKTLAAIKKLAGL